MATVPKPSSPCCNGGCAPTERNHETLQQVLKQNREWAESMKRDDPGFFERLSDQQAPEFLWIGCSDSRVPANQILGLAPGEVFVQRNVGNQALHTDMNVMSCLEFAVKSLKVKTIILCGHYGCGAVRAALQLPSTSPGLVNCWISDIREAARQAGPELDALSPDDAVARLCELNVLRQVFHVCTSSVVQSAWAEGQELRVHGVIYDLRDGLIRRLAGPLGPKSDVATLRYSSGGAPVAGTPSAGGVASEGECADGSAATAAAAGSSRGPASPVMQAPPTKKQRVEALCT